MQTDPTPPGRVTVRSIAVEVSEATGVPLEALYGRGSSRLECTARALVAHRARQAGYSLKQIGRVLNRHYTAVINMMRLAEVIQIEARAVQRLSEREETK